MATQTAGELFHLIKNRATEYGYMEHFPPEVTPPTLAAHYDAIKKIKDFREKLQYYNEHVTSLAIIRSAGEIIIKKKYGYIKKDDPLTDEDILYLGPFVVPGYSNTLKKNFTKNHDKIFLEERQNEIDRIKAGIAISEIYREKLDFALSIKYYGLIYPGVTRISDNLAPKDVKGVYIPAMLTHCFGDVDPPVCWR